MARLFRNRNMSLKRPRLAVQKAASDYLILAALLHDVGRLFDGQDEDLAIGRLYCATESGLYLAGNTFLHCDYRTASHRIASHRIASHRIASHRIASHRIASHRLHVAAKSYLCAVNDRYLAGLSPAPIVALPFREAL